MKTIHVKSSRGRYQVLIGKNLCEKTGTILSSLGFQGKVLIVTQTSVADFHLSRLLKSIGQKKISHFVHRIPDGEIGKSKEELFRIHNTLVKNDFERKDMILALGGGVVGDVAGFAASTYLRGLAFVNVGTTLLAQVDSSIGGKTGINLMEGKNLVGAFYPPRLVISDMKVLSTLPEREYRASLGEVVKYGVIRDGALFKMLEKKTEKVLKRNPQVLETIVTASSKIKADVVMKDEFETSGLRMILNFGHTFGHGFEQALDYKKLMHGEAVAIGMVCAAETARELGSFSKMGVNRLKQLLENLHLPVSLRGLDIKKDRILTAMLRDKKKKAGKLRFVLPTQIGRVVIRNHVPLRLVQNVLLKALSGWE